MKNEQILDQAKAVIESQSTTTEEKVFASICAGFDNLVEIAGFAKLDKKVISPALYNLHRQDRISKRYSTERGLTVWESSGDLLKIETLSEEQKMKLIIKAVREGNHLPRAIAKASGLTESQVLIELVKTDDNFKLYRKNGLNFTAWFLPGKTPKGRMILDGMGGIRTPDDNPATDFTELKIRKQKELDEENKNRLAQESELKNFKPKSQTPWRDSYSAELLAKAEEKKTEIKNPNHAFRAPFSENNHEMKPVTDAKQVISKDLKEKETMNAPTAKTVKPSEKTQKNNKHTAHSYENFGKKGKTIYEIAELMGITYNAILNRFKTTPELKEAYNDGLKIYNENNPSKQKFQYTEEFFENCGYQKLTQKEMGNLAGTTGQTIGQKLKNLEFYNAYIRGVVRADEEKTENSNYELFIVEEAQAVKEILPEHIPTVENIVDLVTAELRDEAAPTKAVFDDEIMVKGADESNADFLHRVSEKALADWKKEKGIVDEEISPDKFEGYPDQTPVMSSEEFPEKPETGRVTALSYDYNDAEEKLIPFPSEPWEKETPGFIGGVLMESRPDSVVDLGAGSLEMNFTGNLFKMDSEARNFLMVMIDQLQEFQDNRREK